MSIRAGERVTYVMYTDQQINKAEDMELISERKFTNKLIDKLKGYIFKIEAELYSCKPKRKSHDK